MPPSDKHWRVRAVKQFKEHSPADSRNSGAYYRRYEQNKNFLQPAEGEIRLEIIMDYFRRDQRFDRVTQSETNAGPNVSITHEIGGNRRGDDRCCYRQSH